jgi:CheY-like chemotaxis protein
MSVRLLVVEDNSVIADAIRYMLDDACEMVYAADGDAARDILTSDDSFDAVLCDVRMPRLGGLGLLSWARAERPALVRRLVFMTQDRTLPAAREIASSHRVLAKPFTRDALLEAIRAIGAQP